MQSGSVSFDELAERFNVSRMTIHRDLDHLAKGGFLRKDRGVATAESSLLFESSLAYRRQVSVSEKKSLARAATSLVESGTVIMIDDSSTNLFLAGEIKNIDPLTVVTNSSAVCDELRGCPNIQLIATGGVYSANHQAWFGMLCEHMLGKMRVDWAFMSTPSVIGLSLYSQDQEVARVKRAMMASAERRALLINARKFKIRALNHFAELTEFNRVFIAGNPGPDVTAELEQERISYRIV